MTKQSGKRILPNYEMPDQLWEKINQTSTDYAAQLLMLDNYKKYGVMVVKKEINTS